MIHITIDMSKATLEEVAFLAAHPDFKKMSSWLKENGRKNGISFTTVGSPLTQQYGRGLRGMSSKS